MGTKETGKPSCNFGCYDELDKLLRQKQQIVTPVIASSTKGDTSKWCNVLLLQSFEIKVNYIPGRSNIVADTSNSGTNQESRYFAALREAMTKNPFAGQIVATLPQKGSSTGIVPTLKLKNHSWLYPTEEFHDTPIASHPGVERTINKIIQRYIHLNT